MAAIQPDDSDLIDASGDVAAPDQSDTADRAGAPEGSHVLPSLTARMEERFFAPFKRNVLAARTWQFVTAAFIVAIYGLGLLWLVRWDSEHPQQQLAKQEETPVEVVVEKPPPPPPPKKPEPPKPETKQEIEKPATSAPRAPNEEKVETEKQDKATQAPKAAMPPADGKPDAAKEAASPSKTPTPDPAKTEDAAEQKPDPDDKDAEALDRAVPLPPKRPVTKEAKVKQPAKLKREREQAEQLAGLSDLPDYKFARPTKKSPVYGGSEDSRYLAIVYGMIMRKYRPTAFAPSDSASVTLTFEVDGAGMVEDIAIAQTSGYPEIDAEAVTAIRRASPFPPPPAGAPHGLIATLDVAQGAQRMSPIGR